jgi:ATP-dependent RNA helicase DDX27
MDPDTIESDEGEDITTTTLDDEIVVNNKGKVNNTTLLSEWFNKANGEVTLVNNTNNNKQASWDFNQAISNLKKQERNTSQSVTTSLQDKIRKVINARKSPSNTTTNNNDDQPIDDNSFHDSDNKSESSKSDDDGDDDNSSSSTTSEPVNLNEENTSSDRLIQFSSITPPPTTTTTTIPPNQPTTFSQLHLSRVLLRAIQSLGFETPTPIQNEAIPHALKGRDILGSAVTGSGKTAAYLLPVLERLLHRDKRTPATRVLILVPTRELAQQIASMVEKLGQFTDITNAVVVGGVNLINQAAIIRSRPDILISTPGRLIDHLRNTQSFDVDNVEILILDEADRLLELGFQDELKEICKFTPVTRQTMLFSATLTTDVNKLAELSLNNPIRVSTDPLFDVAQRLVQEFIRVRDETLRHALLVALCMNTVKERAIIFFESKRDAHRMSIAFGLLGFKAAELHGNLTQMMRLDALQQFSSGNVDYLLCTDLAARGLDIPGVRWVVNFDIPKDLTTYVHRVGRTARAGLTGRCVTLVGEGRRSIMRELLRRSRNMANLLHRKVSSSTVKIAGEKLDSLQQEIELVLNQEREEREMRLATMQLQKAENMIDHQDEIYSRPKRTWFQTGLEKKRLKYGSGGGGEEEGEEEDNHNRTSDDPTVDNEEAKKQQIKEMKKRKREELEQIEKNREAIAQKILAKRAKKNGSSSSAGNSGIGSSTIATYDDDDDDDNRIGRRKARVLPFSNHTNSTHDISLSESAKNIDKRDRLRKEMKLTEPRILSKKRKSKSGFQSKGKFKRR